MFVRNGVDFFLGGPVPGALWAHAVQQAAARKTAGQERHGRVCAGWKALRNAADNITREQTKNGPKAALLSRARQLQMRRRLRDSETSHTRGTLTRRIRR